MLPGWRSLGKRIEMSASDHYCHNCGASFLGSQTHCNSCGAHLSQPAFRPSPQAARYCHGCGAGVAESQNFCGSCGTQLSQPAGQPAYGHPQQRAAAAPHTLDYYIPPSRILLLSVLSASLYGFYWFYITWKHFRDHTGDELNFPVWHALTQLVPIYNLFRFHHHVRVYEHLMDGVGLRPTIAAGTAVILMAIALAAGVISIVIVQPAVNEQVSQAEAVTSFVFSLVSVVVPWFVMYSVQANLNRYWLAYADRNRGVSIVTSEVGAGAIALTILGVLLWIITISSLFIGDSSGTATT